MDRAYMLRCAERAEATATNLADDRATGLLTRAADYLRQGAAVYDTDPTLVRDRAFRDRPLQLLSELGRQITPLTRQTVESRMPERWPEAEELVDRMSEVLKDAQAAAVDVTIPSASEHVSGLRLEVVASYIEDSAETIREMLRPALELPHTHPAAKRLLALADQISKVVAEEPWAATADTA